MANITVRDPFEMTSNLRQMMDRFFDDSFPRIGNPFLEAGTLPVDMYEQGGKLWVRASVPGFASDEIDVQVHEGILSITASKESETEERGERWYRRERSTGSLNRRIALPGIVRNADVEATLENGVLTLSLALPEAAKPKQIEIKSPQANGTV